MQPAHAIPYRDAGCGWYSALSCFLSPLSVIAFHTASKNLQMVKVIVRIVIVMIVILMKSDRDGLQDTTFPSVMGYRIRHFLLVVGGGTRR